MEVARIIFEEDPTPIDSINDYPDIGRLIFIDRENNLNLISNSQLVYREKINIEGLEAIKLPESSKESIRIKSILIKNSLKNNLDWGVLTGVRPSKLVRKLLEDGLKEEELVKYLEEDYLLSRKNIFKLLEINKLQESYIYPLDNKRYSIYIHIPFCPSICSYCSFGSYRIDSLGDKIGPYINSLVKELEVLKSMDSFKINTIYIGGGTPTSLPKTSLEALLKSLNNLIDMESVKEFTVEAGRPDTIDLETLRMLKDMGVDRISINPQTMKEESLKRLGRNHTLEDIYRAYEDGRKVGFKTINMDLILGLPGETYEDMMSSLKEVVDLGPDNLTIHSLAIKSKSKIANDLNKGLLSNSEIKNLSEVIDELTIKNFYKPYYLYRQKLMVNNMENIGYSKEGHYCAYNISMMEERESILAFGLGGVSKIFKASNKEIIRLPNYRGLKDYIENVDKNILDKLDGINIIKEDIDALVDR